MTLIIEHNPTPELRFAIKSTLAPELNLDLITVRFQRPLLEASPGAFQIDTEFNHTEFCSRLREILLELNGCQSIPEGDARLIFLMQLRETKLVDGYMKMINSDADHSSRLLLPDPQASERVDDFIAEAQANILTAARYVLTNTDLMTQTNEVGKVIFADPRLELMEFARSAVITASNNVSADARHYSVNFPKGA